MPNPPWDKKEKLTRSQRKKKRRERELAEQRQAIYDEASPTSQKETAELVSRSMRWELDKVSNHDGRNMSARQRALEATMRCMESDDPAVIARHIANLIDMDKLNQADEQSTVAGGDNHQHLHLHGADSGESLLEQMQRAIQRPEDINDKR